MQSFRPYSIHHIPLAALDDFDPPERSYVVCWWKKIPLGHIWFDNKSEQDFKLLASQAISPALSFYLGNQRHEKWTAFLSEKKFGLLNDFIEGHPIHAHANDSSPEKLSVIICTRNRPEALKKCISRLMQSTDADFELIVVDNAPEDDSTANAIKTFPAIRYIREERKGLDFARNAGLQIASHPIIAFTDDDVEVDIDWTMHIKTCFQDRLTMAVTGLVIPSELKTESQYKFEKFWSFNKGYKQIVFDHTFFLNNLACGVPVWDIGAGANMAFRREVFDIVGLFDTRLGAGTSGCSDDTELWYRVLASGWNCVYLPHIFVFHQHRQGKKDFQRQLFYYMRGHVCSLLVQYEKYAHKGNLIRFRKILPKYYFRRIKNSITGAHENLGTVGAEMRGWLSGWLYYHRTKKDPGYHFPIRTPDNLNEPVNIRPGSLVSVIVPCYNHAKFLGKAIESVLTQTYAHTEIIVVDDGSTDDPLSVCNKYGRVKYIRVERVGLPAARNIGAQFSNGKFLVFLDADDYLYPEGVEHNIRCFESRKELVMVSGSHDRVDSAGNLLPGEKALERTTDNYNSLLQGNYIGMEATVMYRRELFFAFHFDSRLKAGEDYDLNLNIARHFPVYGHTQKIAAYHIHGNNMSRDKNLMLQTTLRILRNQEKSLRSSAERKALESGINNWKYYYNHVAQ